jgi:Bromodomain
MDLSSIKRSIETGAITSAEAFQRDLQLVFLNAIMYNPVNHDVAAMALEMQKDSHEEFQVYAAVAQESRSYKRETREGSRRHEPLEEVVPSTPKFVTIISSSSDDEESSGNGN